MDISFLLQFPEYITENVHLFEYIADGGDDDTWNNRISEQERIRYEAELLEYDFPDSEDEFPTEEEEFEQQEALRQSDCTMSIAEARECYNQFGAFFDTIIKEYRRIKAECDADDLNAIRKLKEEYGDNAPVLVPTFNSEKVCRTAIGIALRESFDPSWIQEDNPDDYDEV